MHKAVSGLLLFLFAACTRGPDVERLTILFTGDLEGHAGPLRDGSGGLARVAAIKKQVQAENPRTVLLDAGDATVGTALATETRGEAIVRLMNLAGYDAALLGNHEFDFGRPQVARYRELADFPYLAGNVKDESGQLVADAAFQVFTLGRVRLGVIGIANPNTVHLVDPAGVQGLVFAEPDLVIRQAQDALAEQADVVILLSHLGLGEDSRLTRKIQGIGLILGGHSQVEIHGLRIIQEVRIMHTGEFGQNVGRVDIYYNVKKKQVVKWDGELIRTRRSIPEDPGVKAALKKEDQVLPPGTDRVLCRLWWGKDRAALGPWVAEVIKDRLGADFGIINTGGVRADLPRGPVTPADLYEIMPFNDRLARFEMKGRDLEQLRQARHLYVSSGPRLEENQTYTVGSADFLLKIHEFPGSRHSAVTDLILRQVLIERIAAKGGIR
jgi:2',3'-cyclic-nucleotide 2'-phosphodiesterase (5'-nucleotidase family)